MRRITLILLSLAAAPVLAGPVVQPGDIGLRHDIQVLADYGVISGPVTTWPLSWDALAADLQLVVDSDRILPVAVNQTMQRVMARANRELRLRDTRFNVRAAAAAEPMRIRGFADTPREEGELSAGLSWFGEHLSLDLNATGVSEPDDDQELRADGSRIAIDMGNVTLAISTMDRWWGPGWDGSLILSNNARPMPAITFGRNRTHAFNSKWLSWLGPWDIEIMMGQLEEERVVPNALFFGMRFVFRPTPSLEIGLSRSAQWCGDGRPCDFDTFVDLFFGKDNVGDAGTTEENEPGNQLGGVDMRWSNRWFRQPSAIYVQGIGEDEAGGFPSRYMGLIGVETSGYIKQRWSYRWFAELAVVTCDFPGEDGWNCAYNHGIYQTGYRYRGQAIGHGGESDARILSSGFVVVTPEDAQWQALLRVGDLNRGGAPDMHHTLTPTPVEITSFDLRHSRSLGNTGWLEIGVGYQRLEDALSGEDENDARGFIRWRSR